MSRRARVALGLSAMVALFTGGLLLSFLVIGDRPEDATAARCNCTTTRTVTTTTPGPTTTVVQTVTETVTEPAATSTLIPPAPVWSADHETGDMSQWPSATLNWDDAGACSFHDVSQDFARSGSWSLKLTLASPGGCRQARLPEIQTGGTYVYEASYYLPAAVSPTSGHWNVFQFKSKAAGSSGSDPIWTIDFQGTPLRPVLAWKGGQHGLAGPMVGDPIALKEYPNDLTTVPVGQWTTLRVYLDQSAGFDGRITVWHDDTLIYDLSAIRTEYPSLDARWSVNNYSNGLSAFPYTLYIDDAAIWNP